MVQVKHFNNKSFETDEDPRGLNVSLEPSILAMWMVQVKHFNNKSFVTDEDPRGLNVSFEPSILAM